MIVSRFSRRRALSGVVTAGLSLPLLAACADDSTTTTTAADPVDAPTSESSGESSSGGGDGGDALSPTSDIPVGSGVIFTDSRVVVTQPEAGDFKCFSAVCTHTGCLVGTVTSTIVCPCHGSSFDISTGAVLGGPASAPLPAVDFTVENDQVVLS
ncbi:Rieske (2Fe-2S) protein [soil metagenome]